MRLPRNTIWAVLVFPLCLTFACTKKSQVTGDISGSGQTKSVADDTPSGITGQDSTGPCGQKPIIEKEWVTPPYDVERKMNGSGSVTYVFSFKNPNASTCSYLITVGPTNSQLFTGSVSESPVTVIGEGRSTSLSITLTAQNLNEGVFGLDLSNSPYWKITATQGGAFTRVFPSIRIDSVCDGLQSCSEDEIRKRTQESMDLINRIGERFYEGYE